MAQIFFHIADIIDQNKNLKQYGKYVTAGFPASKYHPASQFRIFRFNPCKYSIPPLCVSISLLFFTALQQGGAGGWRHCQPPPSPPPLPPSKTTLPCLRPPLLGRNSSEQIWLSLALRAPAAESLEKLPTLPIAQSQPTPGRPHWITRFFTKSNFNFLSISFGILWEQPLPLPQALSHVCSIFRNFLVLAINPIMIAPIRRPATIR